jgi:hypothetical protein
MANLMANLGEGACWHLHDQILLPLSDRDLSSLAVASTIPLTVAAKRLQVCPRTLKRWRQTGAITEDEMWQTHTKRWVLTPAAVRRLATRRDP